MQPEGAGSAYSINDDGKGKLKSQKLCSNCQRKEGAANNLEVLSSGSHRDDVSQSTMAARSSKTFAEGNTSIKTGEMNATMTTIHLDEAVLCYVNTFAVPLQAVSVA